MNAIRRLEEFILKLSTGQNEHGLFNKINEMKQKIYLNDLELSKKVIDSKTKCAKLEESNDGWQI